MYVNMWTERQKEKWNPLAENFRTMAMRCANEMKKQEVKPTNLSYVMEGRNEKRRKEEKAEKDEGGRRERERTYE
jgi:hypothetical protein